MGVGLGIGTSGGQGFEDRCKGVAGTAGRRFASQLRGGSCDADCTQRCPGYHPVLGSVTAESGLRAARSRRARGRGGRGRRHHRPHRRLPAGDGGQACGRARARAAGRDRHRAHHGAPDDGHGHAPPRAGGPARPPARAGGLGRRARGHPPDRHHRPRPRHRLRLRLGRRLPARADRLLTGGGGGHLPRRRRAGAGARVRRRLRRRRAGGRRAGDARRRTGAIPSAPLSGRARARDRRRRRPHLRAQRRRRVQRRAARGHRERLRGHGRRRDHRHAQPARRPEQPAGGDAVPDQAGALYELRRRGAGAEGPRARCAVVGHQGSLPLPARRTGRHGRSRDLRRRGSQDRAGDGDAGLLRGARSRRSATCFPRRA